MKYYILHAGTMLMSKYAMVCMGEGRRRGMGGGVANQSCDHSECKVHQYWSQNMLETQLMVTHAPISNKHFTNTPQMYFDFLIYHNTQILKERKK